MEKYILHVPKEMYWQDITQQEGFEPPERCRSSAFEADAISQLDHCCVWGASLIWHTSDIVTNFVRKLQYFLKKILLFFEAVGSPI